MSDVTDEERKQIQVDSLLKKLVTGNNKTQQGIQRAQKGAKGELGPDVILKVYLTPYGQTLARLNIPGVTKTSIWRDLTRTVYTPVKATIDSAISQLVPSDMGRLRESMKSSLTVAYRFTTLETSDLTYPHTLFTVALGTPGIPYAKYANDMPTQWLSHPGSHKAGKRGRMGAVLADPKAETKFYEKCLVIGRITAQSNWRVFKTRMVLLFGGGATGAREFRLSFQVYFQ